jgi:acyl-CoA dehydrogenase
MTATNEFAALTDQASARLFEPFANQAAWRKAGDRESFAALWAGIEASGFADILCTDGEEPRMRGRAAFALLRNAGRALLPAPLGETAAARFAWRRAGLAPVEGAATLATDGAGARAGYGRFALWLAASQNGRLVRLPAKAAALDENMAGEPRDTMALDAKGETGGPMEPLALRALGAAMRAAQIAGAADRALALSVEHAKTRVQFGRPIGQFQAVQHALAVAAGHCAAAAAAAEWALMRIEDEDFIPMAAAAKIRAGEAAGACAAVAHQVHGAIGITDEHELHFATRRLLAWRAEFGSEGEWSRYLGNWTAAQGPDGYWAAVAG